VAQARSALAKVAATAIRLLRHAAGKIFGPGVLMYGKEPSWREMWRWAREA
jgi:ABC-2 type transport system permease protein